MLASNFKRGLHIVSFKKIYANVNSLPFFFISFFSNIKKSFMLLLTNNIRKIS